MDQEVLENVKRYKWELLRDLLLKNSGEMSFTDFAKNLTGFHTEFLACKGENFAFCNALK